MIARRSPGVREGAIGDIISGSVYWNSQRPWWKTRKREMCGLAYQAYNWGRCMWLCGHHIVEQHVHTIDVANWFLGMVPETASGVGGLPVRPRPWVVAGFSSFLAKDRKSVV